MLAEVRGVQTGMTDRLPEGLRWTRTVRLDLGLTPAPDQLVM